MGFNKCFQGSRKKRVLNHVKICKVVSQDIFEHYQDRVRLKDQNPTDYMIKHLSGLNLAKYKGFATLDLKRLKEKNQSK